MTHFWHISEKFVSDIIMTWFWHDSDTVIIMTRVWHYYDTFLTWFWPVSDTFLTYFWKIRFWHDSDTILTGFWHSYNTDWLVTLLWHDNDTILTHFWHISDIYLKSSFLAYLWHDNDMILTRFGLVSIMTWLWHVSDTFLTRFWHVSDRILGLPSDFDEIWNMKYEMCKIIIKGDWIFPPLQIWRFEIGFRGLLTTALIRRWFKLDFFMPFGGKLLQLQLSSISYWIAPFWFTFSFWKDDENVNMKLLTFGIDERWLDYDTFMTCLRHCQH